MRLLLLLGLVLVACKSKSEPAAEQQPAAPAGSGVAAPATGDPRPKDDPAPATPTPARPDDTLKPAARPSEKPAPGGISDVNGQRLPAGTVAFTSIAALDSSTLTVEDAGELIRTDYKAGLERCYRVHLASQPGANGTAKLTFTVEVNGQVTGATVASFARDLESCAAMMALNWRFPVPTDPKTSKPAKVRFAVELMFTPG
jgi:outer membrane biosynthesis protein TonB